MKHIGLSLLAGVALGLAALNAGAHHTPAHAAAMGDAPAAVPARALSVTGCWVRAMPSQVPSAAYFTIANSSDMSATLVDVSSDAYGSVMMHATTQTGGMSRMSMTHDVSIPARGQVSFEPGGLHVMLSKPARTIEVGKTLDLTLSFAGNVSVRAACAIREPSALTR